MPSRAFSDAYFRLLQRFIPPEIAQHREAANCARMFLISHTVGPILGNSVPLALYLLDPTPGWDLLALGAAINAFWIFPFLLKAGISYTRLVSASVLNLNFSILLSLYYNGGVSSPTTPWILIIPILSLFYIGGDPKVRMRLLLISAGCFAVFFALYLIGQPPRNDLPEYAQHGLGIVSTLAALCYVAMMAIYYGRIFDASRELEAEVRRRRGVSEELRGAVIAIEAATAARSEFLARMSHELRTPLNAVIGYGQILKEDAIEERDAMMEKDVDKILDAGQYLLRLINMILDLSKIEAGRMSFDSRPLAIEAVLAAVAQRHGERAREMATRLSVSCATDLGPLVGDEQRVTQILDAVIENAVTHTRGGTVTVEARPATDAAMFQIAVRDTGAGIPPAVLSTLFETFSVDRDAAEGRYGGTGLNLTLVHRLCKAMGGSIEATSTVGEGSMFTITLPRGQTHAAGSTTRPQRELALAA
ncbi:sensor histidine kinase [Aureimonas phyllosphaerae]|uniref:sensor histidine kinase n=1 Tax=Aureimonas phyllosphaerae TaxID=1166078 RepID=UPI003A5BE41A